MGRFSSDSEKRSIFSWPLEESANFLSVVSTSLQRTVDGSVGATRNRSYSARSSTWLLRLGRRFFRRLGGDCFCFLEHTQQVAAKDGLDFGLGITAIEETLRDVGVGAGVFKLGWQDGDAVVVGADADVLDAGDFGDVVDVVEQVVDGATRVRVFGLPAAHFAGDFLVAQLIDLEKFSFEVHALGHGAYRIGDDVAGEEVDHDDAVFFLDAFEHIIWHVAGMIGDAHGRGMGEDDGGGGDIERVVHGFGGDVREIDEHADFVHFADDIFAKRREAVGFFLVGARVGPIERVGVGECHVAGTEVVELLEHHEGFLDAVAAFDANEAGDFSFAVDSFDVVCRVSEFERFGVAGDHSLDEVDLLERGGERFATVTGFDGNPHGPELCADAALAELGDIGLQRGLFLGNVELIEVGIALFADFPGHVVVAVDEKRLAVQFASGIGEDDGLAAYGLLGFIGGCKVTCERE